MNIYYAVVSRDEFISLYKFGELNISYSSFVPNILKDENSIENSIIELLKGFPFSDEEDYLILEIYYKPRYPNDRTIWLAKLESVINIYTLSKKSQLFYSTKFDPNIRFQVTKFKKIIKNIYEFKEVEDMDRGIDILSKEFNFKISKIEADNNFNKEFKYKFLHIGEYLLTGQQGFYLDLISYHRKNKMINNDISYIYDLMIIVILEDKKTNIINSLKNGTFNLNSFQSYKKMERNRNLKLYKVIEFIKNTKDNNIINFREKIGEDKLIIGSIFLNIKSLLLSSDKNYKKDISNIKKCFDKSYKKQVNSALYLIGLVFGYKELYSSYYENINLSIFKNHKNNIELSEETSLSLLQQSEVKSENQVKQLSEEKEESQKQAMVLVKEKEKLSDENQLLSEEKEVTLRELIAMLRRKSLDHLYFDNNKNNKNNAKLKDIQKYSDKELMFKILNDFST
jgi:hypothetical protein